MRRAALGFCLAATAWCANAARAGQINTRTLYASANESPGSVQIENIYAINETNGMATIRGSGGIVAPIDLASDWGPGPNRLWAVDSIENGPNRLVELGLATGLAIDFHDFGTPNRMQSLAFDPASGEMYGTDIFDRLFKIDPDTAVSTSIDFVRIGATRVEGILALAFDDTGTLYGVSDETQQLVRINTDDATATAIGPTNLAFLNDLAFVPDDDDDDAAGDMFAVSAATDSIYAIDLNTGATALKGPYDAGLTYIDGLAFAVIPEPATLSLLGLGALALIRRRRSYQRSVGAVSDRD